jgi:hypothetical protein
MNMSDIPSYTKLELAEIQLNRAIKLLVHDGDVVSSITLSGAADDIIWKSLEETGVKSQLTEIEEQVVEWCKLNETPFNKTTFRNDMHVLRTELKHLRTEFSAEKIPIPIEAAIEIIDRCCENFRRLTGRYPEQRPLFANLYGQ